jgi:hypothetical protein
MTGLMHRSKAALLNHLGTHQERLGDRDPDCLRGSKVDNKIEYFRTPLLLSAVLISERIEQFHQNRTQFRGAFSEGEFFAPDHSTNSVTEFNRRRMVRTVQPTHQGLGRLSDRTLGAEFGYKRLDVTLNAHTRRTLLRRNICNRVPDSIEWSESLTGCPKLDVARGW